MASTNSAPDLKDFAHAITTDPDLKTVFINATERSMSMSLKKR